MTPQPVTLLIPVAAGTLSAWLKDDDLPAWLNYTIFGVFFVLAVVVSIVANGGFTNDLNGNLYLIVTACMTIMAALIGSKASGALSSPLSGVAAGMAQKAAQKAEQKREFEQWQASQHPAVRRASAVQPTPPPGGSVIAPPSTPADAPTRFDLPAIPPRDPTNPQ